MAEIFPAVFAHGERGQLDGLVGDGALGADARHRLAVDAALVQLDPARAGQRVDGPVELRSCASSRPATGRFWPVNGRRSSSSTLPARRRRCSTELASKDGMGADAVRNAAAVAAARAAAEVDFGASAAQQAVLNVNARRPSSCPWPRPNPDGMNCGWAGARRSDYCGQSRRPVAWPSRCRQGADRRASRSRCRENRPGRRARRAGLRCRSSVARQAQSAQTVSNSPRLPEWKSTVSAEGLVQRIRAQMAVRLQLAGGQIKFQLAQIDRAVALGIGGVDLTAGGRLVRHDGLRRRSEAQARPARRVCGCRR